MVSSVGRTNFTGAAAAATAPPSLDAQLNTCRAQLEDWVTCPSAKTPEGKAKIEQITTRMDSIKSEIEKVGRTADSKATPARAGLDVQRAPDTALASGGTVGRNVDVYA